MLLVSSAAASRVMLLLLALSLTTQTTAAAGFNCSISGCANSGNCTATGACACPMDKLLPLTGDRCEQVALLTPAPLNKLVATDLTFVQSDAIDLTTDRSFRGGIPLSDNELATRIYVCSNGYVTFNWDFCTTRVDLLKSSWTPPFVAPFANSFDFRKTVSSVSSTSEVSYKLLPDVTADAGVKKIRDGIAELTKATAAIVFIWTQMSPPPLDTTQKISFQLILFTDFETVTGAVTLYSSTNTLKDYFDWLPTLIGSRTATGGSASLIGDRRSSSVHASLQAVPIGTGFAATARLTVLYNGTAPNYRQRCFAESALPMQPSVNTATLGLCPRSYRQAIADPRYTRVTGPASGLQVFNLVFAQSTNSTQISCAYDTASGGLLRASSYSNITAFNLRDNLNSRLYEYCCDRVPTLCDLYYNKLPAPTSDNYQGPSAVGFAMGTGELRSFDGQLSRFMAVGDYWLVKSSVPSRLSVQVRMRNINPANNLTTAITGVALQFSGTTNFSTEFHWNRTTQQIVVNTIVISGPSGSFQMVGDKPLDQVGQYLNKDAIFVTLTSSSLACAIASSSTWITAQSSSNGLSVSVYLDKTGYFKNVTSGLLGNYDDNKSNDVAYRNGTTGTPVSSVLEDWRLMTNESLFKVSPADPAAPSGWSALYWSAEWNNQMQMVQALFGGNSSIYVTANQTCTATLQASSTEYQNCLMEFANCGSQCAKAYTDQLASATQTLNNFTDCTATIPWNNVTEIAVTEGTSFEVGLDTMVSGVLPKGATFAKVSGPADLSVNQSGALLWASPAVVNVNATPIIVSVSATVGCANIVQLSVRLTRTSKASGVCDNSVEDFGYLTSPPGQNFRRDKIYSSVCKCNANYYTANCSAATCPLACHSCNSTAATACTACPANYAASEVATTPKLAVCSYTDQCSVSGRCSGAEYKSCRSLDPAMQTSSSIYQCVCNSGYGYPNSASKTVCSDINECNILGYCDTTANRICSNTIGSFTCDCSPGYSLQSGQCADIDECSSPGICPNANCVNTPGSYYCNCSRGYVQITSSSNCTDVNECMNPGLSNCQQNCTNTPGSFNCICFNGFTVASGSCSAVNPCTNSSICSYPSLCARITSTDTCNCPTPQTLQADKQTCSAMKYCASNPCGANGNCTELNPGYTCSCKPYYELNSARVCVAIDYCNRRNQYPSVCPTGDNVDCSVNATTNEPKCICKSGYSRSPTTNTCVDINECSAGTSGCDPSSTDCVNLIGSWLCKCKFGYKRLNSTHCSPAAYAIQVQATFTDLVYQANLANPSSQDFLLMAQMIESRLELGLPSDGAGQPTFRVSSMTNGSVVAAGVVSYSTPQTPATVTSGGLAAGLSVVATSLNECLSNSTNDCLPAVHNCIDTVDGYICRCKSGYTQTGTNSGYAGTYKVIEVCTDIDECLTQCRNDSNKVCVNLPGSFTCNCIKGTYSTNATSLPCEDPCIAGRCKNSGQCQYQANDQFPYRCVCMAGYTGFHCELLDDYYWSMQRNAIIIGVVLGVLLLICLAALVIFFLRKYRSDKNRADFYQSNFSDNPASHSGGTYKGTQSIAMSDTSIPRAQHSAHHPSTYENMGYERETHKARTDYF